MEETPIAAMEATGKKGTVTPFASMFPANEAQKAAKRVDDKIEQRQKEFECIKDFITENNNLINLVSKLPDELHHDIMVPFGKAAFFPGRLIHTNELMVLLGDGYYAERTAKQTVEILKRRGKALDSQVESLKANMKDLKAEASFFDTTASEAAEGLVEIREDFEEKNSSERHSKLDKKKDGKEVAVEDDEYARIMSRLDELEQEELAAEGKEVADEDDDESEDELADVVGSDSENDADEQTNNMEIDKNYENIRTKANFDQVPHQIHPEARKPQKHTVNETLSNKYHPQQNITDHSNVLMQTTTSGFPGSQAFTGSIVENADAVQTNSQQQARTSSQASEPAFDSSKAFTGSIVERASNLPPSKGSGTASSQSSNSQPSKPVSRFKMRRN